MAKTEYSDQQRQQALELYEQEGPTAVETQLGIPKSTVRSWAKAAGVRTVRVAKTRAATEAAVADRERLRETARDLMAQRVVDLLERIEEEHVEFVGKDGRRETLAKATGSATRDYSVSVGILVDKLRLELGEATERTEHLSQSEFDREVAELVGKLGKQGRAGGDRARNGNGRVPAG